MKGFTTDFLTKGTISEDIEPHVTETNVYITHTYWKQSYIMGTQVTTSLHSQCSHTQYFSLSKQRHRSLQFPNLEGKANEVLWQRILEDWAKIHVRPMNTQMEYENSLIANTIRAPMHTSRMESCILCPVTLSISNAQYNFSNYPIRFGSD